MTHQQDGAERQAQAAMQPSSPLRPPSPMPGYAARQAFQPQEQLSFGGFNTGASGTTAWPPAASAAAASPSTAAHARRQNQSTAGQWPQLSVAIGAMTRADPCNEGVKPEPMPAGRPQRHASPADHDAGPASPCSGSGSPSKRKRPVAAADVSEDESPRSPPKLSRAAARARPGKAEGAAAHADAAAGSATSAFRGVSRHRQGPPGPETHLADPACTSSLWSIDGGFIIRPPIFQPSSVPTTDVAFCTQADQPVGGVAVAERPPAVPGRLQHRGGRGPRLRPGESKQ